MAKDYLRAEITRQLVPLLSDAGFTRAQPKVFLRRHGDLVHVLSFAGSWSGGQTLTLSFAAALLCDPFFQLHSLQVGHAHQRGPEEPYVPWEGRTEASAAAAIASAAGVVRDTALPWLDGVRDLRGYVFVYLANPDNGIGDLALAVAMARAGEHNRPWWICERLSPRVPDGSDYEKARRERALELQAALERGNVQGLLDHWRDQALAGSKLGDLPDRA